MLCESMPLLQERSTAQPSWRAFKTTAIYVLASFCAVVFVVLATSWHSSVSLIQQSIPSELHSAVGNTNRRIVGWISVNNSNDILEVAKLVDEIVHNPAFCDGIVLTGISHIALDEANRPYVWVNSSHYLLLEPVIEAARQRKIPIASRLGPLPSLWTSSVEPVGESKEFFAVDPRVVGFDVDKLVSTAAAYARLLGWDTGGYNVEDESGGYHTMRRSAADLEMWMLFINAFADGLHQEDIRITANVASMWLLDYPDQRRQLQQSAVDKWVVKDTFSGLSGDFRRIVGFYLHLLPKQKLVVGLSPSENAVSAADTAAKIRFLLGVGVDEVWMWRWPDGLWRAPLWPYLFGKWKQGEVVSDATARQLDRVQGVSRQPWMGASAELAHTEEQVAPEAGADEAGGEEAVCSVSSQDGGGCSCACSEAERDSAVRGEGAGRGHSRAPLSVGVPLPLTPQALHDSQSDRQLWSGGGGRAFPPDSAAEAVEPKAVWRTGGAGRRVKGWVWIRYFLDIEKQTAAALEEMEKGYYDDGIMLVGPVRMEVDAGTGEPYLLVNRTYIAILQPIIDAAQARGIPVATGIGAMPALWTSEEPMLTLGGQYPPSFFSVDPRLPDFEAKMQRLVRQSAAVAAEFGWSSGGYCVDDESGNFKQRKTAADVELWFEFLRVWADGLHRHGLPITAATAVQWDIDDPELQRRYAASPVDQWAPMDLYFGNAADFRRVLGYYQFLIPPHKLVAALYPSGNPSPQASVEQKLRAMEAGGVGELWIFDWPEAYAAAPLWPWLFNQWKGGAFRVQGLLQSQTQGAAAEGPVEGEEEGAVCAVSEGGGCSCACAGSSELAWQSPFRSAF